MKKEIWKSIPGYSSYEASTYGRIRSIDNMRLQKIKGGSKAYRFYPGKIIKPWENHLGYFTATIYKDPNKKKISRPIHILIALTFLGPRPAGLQVAHLNGIKTDNRLENLKYCTPKENCSHRHLHGTHLAGERVHLSKLKTADVLNIRKLIRNGYRQKEIAKKYGISQSQISSIHTKMTWRHII